MDRKNIVKRYFEAQNQSDAEMIVKLFSENSEVCNVNFPSFKGKDGIRSFCNGLYERTSTRNFQIVDLVEGQDIIMVEWTTCMTFAKDAQIGPFELDESFDVQLRGVNKFEFLPNSELIQCLRVYHETTTVVQKAKEYAKK